MRFTAVSRPQPILGSTSGPPAPPEPVPHTPQTRTSTPARPPPLAPSPTYTLYSSPEARHIPTPQPLHLFSLSYCRYSILYTRLAPTSGATPFYTLGPTPSSTPFTLAPWEQSSYTQQNIDPSHPNHKGRHCNDYSSMKNLRSSIPFC